MTRKNALELAESRGFKVGDTLVSKHWKTSRIIISFQTTSILYFRGEYLDAMSTMPDDVRKLES